MTTWSEKIKPKNIGLQQPLAHTHTQQTRETLGKTRAKYDLFSLGLPPSCMSELGPVILSPLTFSSSLLNKHLHYSHKKEHGDFQHKIPACYASVN